MQSTGPGILEGTSSMAQIFTPLNIGLMIGLVALVGFFIYQQTKKGH